MILLWRLLKPHLPLTLALVLTAGGFFLLGYHVGKPKIPSTVKDAQHQVDSVRVVVQKTDTLVQYRTKVLAHTDTAYQQVRDTLLSNIHDTVVVRQFVQACDSLKASCDLFRSAAQSKFAADSQLFSAQAREIAAWKASQPSFGARLKHNALVLLSGVALDQALRHTRYSAPWSFTFTR